MNNSISKSSIIYSLFWKTLERGGAQGIQFVVQIILARLLLPEDYGLIALVTIFISIANVFVQSGFNTSLIQKKDADEVDFSSVFYLSLAVSLVIYLVLFYFAPLIANAYQEPQLVLLLRVLSVTLFFGALNSIQNAYIARNMMFKKLFFSSFGAGMISGLIGIILAYNGAGVWALVVQQLVNQFIITLILWFIVKWRPKLLFSLERVKVLFAFGSKLLASSLLNSVYDNARSLIIGIGYDPEILGFYNRGKQFPQFFVTNIDSSIQSVMLPTLSSSQDDKKVVKKIVRRSIITSTFLMFPLLVGLAAIAEPLVKLLLTDAWLPSVPFLQIFCIVYALRPIHTANLQAINAIGRSDVFLKIEVLKKIVGTIIIIITIPLGVNGMAWGMVVSGLISASINAFPNSKFLDYNYVEQLKDIFPNFIIASLMGLIVYIFSFLNIPDWQLLIIQVLVGGCTYVCLARIFKIEAFTYLINTIKDISHSRKGVR